MIYLMIARLGENVLIFRTLWTDHPVGVSYTNNNPEQSTQYSIIMADHDG